jgi:ABC-2 type transport system permease protein
MFFHEVKYMMKILFGNKSLIFWTFVFPIILGTFFNMAFSNITENEKLKPFSIAIVEGDSASLEIYKEAFKELSKGENKIFDIQYVSLEKADELLENEDIEGYLILNEEKQICIKQNGINQTVFKEVVEEVGQGISIVNTAIKSDIEKTGASNIDFQKVYQTALETYSNATANIKDTSPMNTDYSLIEFYSLIAMTCLYGATLAMYAVNQNLPNMTEHGKRIAISPASKIKLILASVLATFIVQIIGLAILFVYTIFVLKVDFGSRIDLTIMISFLGALAGLALGIFVASTLKCSTGSKDGIIISFTMLCSFFAGMMGISMKYIADKNMPLLNKVNPASMITDGLYSIYYYSGTSRFAFDCFSLQIFSVVLIIISIINLRRQKYDSI